MQLTESQEKLKAENKKAARVLGELLNNFKMFMFWDSRIIYKKVPKYFTSSDKY